MASTSSISRKPADTPLLKLPNELLLKVAGYLAPTTGLLKNQGFGRNFEVDQQGSRETTTARHKHGSEVQTVLNISLTCKQLVPIAQDILYRDVSLPQPYRTQLPNKSAPSSLSFFLRTMVRCPNLAVHVRSLAVWLWKGKPIRSPVEPEKGSFCACGSCVKELGGLVDVLRISTEEKKSWLEELKCPSEAMVCGLVLAALPKLQAVELYAKRLPPDTPERAYKHRHSSYANTQSDIVCLSQGLVTTQISALTLSTDLNGLGGARLLTLTTLTLDYTGSNQFVTVNQGCFVNVKTLKIRTRIPHQHLCEPISRQKLQILMKHLPNLRRLEVESGPALDCYPVPMGVDTMAIYQATYVTLPLLREYLKDQVTFPKHLRRIEVHWDVDLPLPQQRMPAYQEMAKKAGVVIVILSHGRVLEVYE